MPRQQIYSQSITDALKKFQEVRKVRPIDGTYVSEYKKYLIWFEGKGHDPQIGDDGESTRFISRDIVDQYFREIVPSRNGNKNTIGRICNALQWAHDNVEWRDSPNPPQLSLKNGIVKEGIKKQQEEWRQRASTLNLGSDPHKGLKDITPENEMRIVMHHVFKERNDWDSIGPSFTWGNNAGSRGASNRNFVMCDLNLTKGFGPEDSPSPRCRTLMLVLRKGNIHKDNHISDKQIGCYRHRDYLLCPTFHTACAVIYKLSRAADIDFLHPDRRARAKWWDLDLIDFSTLSQESSAMSQVFKATKIDPCKLTHHRTNAVQRAGSESMAPHQISTMTKHVLDKMHQAYYPEVDKKLCAVMAGFSNDEKWYVPRTYLDQPPNNATSWAACCSYLMEGYPVWLQQRHSAEGDKSSCAYKFLDEILPFFTEVLIQDGIYMIEEFPNHPMSQHLKVSSKNR